MSRTDDRRSAISIPLGPLIGDVLELDITALAAGGDGVARDAGGRVTFVPRTAPGDRVRVRIVKTTSSLAHAELLEVVSQSKNRVEPPCPHFELGCGGCVWQHVSRDEQLHAKTLIVTSALRRLAELVIHPIAHPAPAYGWRRRARFHVANGRVGLYAEGTHRVLPIDHCPQLDPRLDEALANARASSPPDGELALVVGHKGDISIGVQEAKRGPAKVIELEPGLFVSAWDFAQASAAGNARLIEIARNALGKGPGKLVELHAGAGNFTRGFIEDGWDVTASDTIAPARTQPGFVVGAAAHVLAMTDHADAIVLDPPRTGAAECIDALVRIAPKRIIYISCDPATLARDAERLVDYRPTDAWPIDLMPQTAHVEVVLRLERIA